MKSPCWSAQPSEKEAVEELLRRGIKEIVVKHGAKGATFYDADAAD
jgi:sugar/nucleoside kinase (ribokinase family)